jgi:hypothetical protein
VGTWTIKIAGETQPLSAAASDCRLSLASLAAGTAQLTVDGAVDGTLLFARGQAVELALDGVVAFAGLVDRVSPAASGTAESYDVLVKDAFGALDELPYMQPRTVYSAGEGGLVTGQYQTRLILGQSPTGARQTVGAAIREVVEYAAASGVSIVAGTIDAGPEFPWEEICDVTCGQAIQRLTRYCPDMVSWIDYFASPPAFHVRRRASLSSTTVAMTACSQVAIQPREDMSPPCVALYYERSNDVAGTVLTSLVSDIYPVGADPRQPRALVSTMQLAGAKSVFQRQYVGATALPSTDIGWAAWWAIREPWLAGARLANLVLHNHARAGALPNELVVGRIEDWMSCSQAEDVVTALADYDLLNDAGAVVKRIRNQLLQQKVTTTDSPAKWWVRSDVLSGAEPIPSGLAQAMYDSMSTPYYDGSLVIEGDDPTLSLRPGLLIRISGGRSEWASMSAAAVQAVEHSIATGSTTLRFGPPSHLSVQDYRALTQWSRRRSVAQTHVARFSADAGDAGAALAFGSAAPKGWTTPALGETRFLRLDGTSYTATLDPSILGRSVGFSERSFCVDVRYNPSEHRLEVKRWTGWVLATGDTTDWVAMEDGDTVVCGA